MAENNASIILLLINIYSKAKILYENNANKTHLNANYVYLIRTHRDPLLPTKNKGECRLSFSGNVESSKIDEQEPGKRNRLKPCRS